MKSNCTIDRFILSLRKERAARLKIDKIFLDLKKYVVDKDKQVVDNSK